MNLLDAATYPCQIHKQHYPVPRTSVRHHIWPVEHGGPDTEDNVVYVCPTSKGNLEQLLQEYLWSQGQAPQLFTRRYSQKERELAELGWARIKRQAM